MSFSRACSLSRGADAMGMVRDKMHFSRLTFQRDFYLNLTSTRARRRLDLEVKALSA